MNSTLSFLHAGRWASEEPVDESVRPANVDRFLRERLPFGKRVSRALSRFLITFCIGVAATLAWQSQGDAVRGDDSELVSAASVAGAAGRARPSFS